MNLLKRLKEPSTWASLAVILLLVGLSGPAEYISGNTETIITLLTAICALFGIGIPEKKDDK